MLTSVSNFQHNQTLNTVHKYYAPSFSSQKQNKPDTFEKQGKMSNGTKWGIGLGLAALGTVLAVVLSRGKGVSSNNIKQLAEHIDFKEAKTMEEAKKYAMDNFGMKLELGEDIFTANLVNDMCTNVSNKLKGKVSFPIKCNFEAMQKNDMASYNIYTHIMSINKNGYTGFSGIDITGLLNSRMKKGASYKEALKSAEDAKVVLCEAVRNMKRHIYHELGHCNHFAVCKEAPNMRNEYSKLYKEFLGEINKTDTKSACSKFFENDYYKTNPAEFVAETFAWKMMGKTAPKEVEELYLKYGGIPFI